MNMNLQRFEQLIDAYGSDPQRWPPAERPAALRLLADSPEAAQWLQQSLWLDEALDQCVPPAFEQLTTRLLQMPLPAQHPAGVFERLMRWLVPAQPAEFAEWWRPAALACVPLAFGLFMGMQLDLFTDPTAEMSADDAELQFIALADYAEPLE